MSSTLSTSISLTVSALLSNSLVKFSVPINFRDALDNGQLVDQADQAWADLRTLASGADDSLDLSGALVNALGQTVNIARVKLVIVINTSIIAADKLIVGGAASNAWEGWTPVAGSKIYVGPGGLAFLYDPSAAAMAVTGGTGDILKIHNNSGANAVTYAILIVGSTS